MKSLRSFNHGRAITNIRIVAISTVTFRISAMWSRTNIPPNAVTVCGGWPWITVKIVTSMIRIAIQWVASRWTSLMNTSYSSTRHAAAVRNSSGTITSRSFKEIMPSPSSELAGHQMRHELRHRRIQQVHQRPRVYAHRQHRDRERAQHPGFARIHPRHRSGFRRGRGAPHDALDQPQRVTGTDDQ